MLLVPIIAALVSCGGADSSTTGADATPTARQQLAFTRVNQLRAASGVAPFTMNQALNVAAVRHAGYQAIRNIADSSVLLTHYETAPPSATPPGVDPPDPNGVPDTTNPLFFGVKLTPRFQAANGGSDLYAPGGHVYYEGITSQPFGGLSVMSLWNTVYHRLPMARNETLIFGYGEANDARTQYPSVGVPLVDGFATTDYAGTGTTAVTASHWPNNGAMQVAGTFATNFESPDPVDAGSAWQSPGFTSHGDVGTPIHVFIPTSQNWTSVTVSLALQSAPGTKLNVYVLAGYFHPDRVNFTDTTVGHNPFPVTTITVDSSVSEWTWDAELDAGELFILPVAPLATATAYQYAVSASAGVPTPDVVITPTIGFTTQ